MIKIPEGKARIVIERVSPVVDSGRFPVKKTVGEVVIVEADILADGHDVISAEVLYRHESEPDWNATEMVLVLNDRWRADFHVLELGTAHYTLQAWIDHFESWRRDLIKKADAGQDVSVDLLVGEEFLEAAIARAKGADSNLLRERLDLLRSSAELTQKVKMASDKDLNRVMNRCADRRSVVLYPLEVPIIVDREKARFSAWYEMFPRSCAQEPGKHGTFKDCEEHLPYVSSMGFDVLYFPPIHPVGHTNRKGKNNSPTAGPEDPGSPWAIGSEEGGHTAIHPQLGTLDDFKRLMSKAEQHHIEIALDLAFQCAADHPWVMEHPSWFRWRPDHSIQYAENPPKKYEDIYPLNFETDDWWELWQALRDVVLFWLDQGIRIFRVDNPHTKPFRFWEWLINEIKIRQPEVIFLSEAFTRPKVMRNLAKLGFTQSYTYFPWRNTKWELTQYFTELCQTELKDYFRPSLWPNTPDILTEYLQLGGCPAFITRLVLAATLGANYGIYGPAFELCENEPREFGSEEYNNSEKYEIRHWDFESPHTLREFIGRVNRIRKENPALQSDRNLRFHPTDNEQIIFYSKHTDDLSNVILCAVNLDPHHTQTGWVELPLQELAIDSLRAFQVHDLLSGARYLWEGPRNYIELNPRVVSAQIFRVRFKLRTERDFDYFM
ncbi:MAG: alpha-1,4-glucan--maltose-1-phosphate maltosyltransferase [Desulfomonilaceae bacterium]